MKPALTAEEWKAKRFATQELMGEALVEIEADEGDVFISQTAEGAYFHSHDRLRLAALALYGQPFGFTREDVEHLRLVAGQCDALRLSGNHAYVLNNLADRIESLLPPTEDQ